MSERSTLIQMSSPGDISATQQAAADALARDATFQIVDVHFDSQSAKVQSMSFGTGYAIKDGSGRTAIVTDMHVVKPGDRIGAIDSHGVLNLANIELTDSANDLAYLQADSLPANQSTFEVGKVSEANAGDYFKTDSHPYANPNVVVTEGKFLTLKGGLESNGHGVPAGIGTSSEDLAAFDIPTGNGTSGAPIWRVDRATGLPRAIATATFAIPAVYCESKSESEWHCDISDHGMTWARDNANVQLDLGLSGSNQHTDFKRSP